MTTQTTTRSPKRFVLPKSLRRLIKPPSATYEPGLGARRPSRSNIHLVTILMLTLTVSIIAASIAVVSPRLLQLSLAQGFEATISTSVGTFLADVCLAQGGECAPELLLAGLAVSIFLCCGVFVIATFPMLNMHSINHDEEYAALHGQLTEIHERLTDVITSLQTKPSNDEPTSRDSA